MSGRVRRVWPAKPERPGAPFLIDRPAVADRRRSAYRRTRSDRRADRRPGIRRRWLGRRGGFWRRRDALAGDDLPRNLRNSCEIDAIARLTGWARRPRRAAAQNAHNNRGQNPSAHRCPRSPSALPNCYMKNSHQTNRKSTATGLRHTSSGGFLPMAGTGAVRHEHRVTDGHSTVPGGAGRARVAPVAENPLGCDKLTVINVLETNRV